MDALLRTGKKIIPKSIFRTIQPLYHWLLALFGALLYRFPSRHIKIVAITGTKGKSSTVELVNAILEAKGYKTALASTVRFKVGEKSRDNLYKMTMPGRFFIQRFLAQAVDEQCTWAIIEMTSEGARQFRHAFINLNALIFLNLSPEHIESHGSYEKYIDAKLSLARALSRSPKKNRLLVANVDDKESGRFLEVGNIEKYPFTLRHAKPFEVSDRGVALTFKETRISSPLRGLFNIYNILAAATFADALGIDTATIQKGIENVAEIKGRVQKVLSLRALPFEVFVDYAHTPDSLEKLYQAFPNQRKICVLGNTGGGRDTWKRPEMGKIADTYCEEIILTNEDPYDEDPKKIIEEMREAIFQKPCHVILDRRKAIHTALTKARKGDVVLISGKGTDPYIMGPLGSKLPWSDYAVAKEEMERLGAK